MSGYITDVPGIKVGHYTNTSRPTGCTAILAIDGAVAGVDVRGGAPGTRETDLLRPVNTVPMVHAITLAGGSAFGLDAATGVMNYLSENGIGFDTRVAHIPIVPAAIIFDLYLGDSTIRPTAKDGYAAAASASSGNYAIGNVGAGAGATIGKLFGPDRAMRGGLGSASIRVGDLIVGALVVVNALGDIIDPDNGKIIAGARDQNGSFINCRNALKAGRKPSLFSASNTTLGVMATNARLNKTEATKVAEMAHDGLARTINPVHTPFDGDTIFALSTGQLNEAIDITIIGSLAAEMIAQAVISGVMAAETYQSIPAAWDFNNF